MLVDMFYSFYTYFLLLLSIKFFYVSFFRLNAFKFIDKHLLYIYICLDIYFNVLLFNSFMQH